MAGAHEVIGEGDGSVQETSGIAAQVEQQTARSGIPDRVQGPAELARRSLLKARNPQVGDPRHAQLSPLRLVEELLVLHGDGVDARADQRNFEGALASAHAQPDRRAGRAADAGDDLLQRHSLGRTAFYLEDPVARTQARLVGRGPGDRLHDHRPAVLQFDVDADPGEDAAEV